jgi:uncharacterized protein YqgV (UPF0045/DUF77 family)
VHRVEFTIEPFVEGQPGPHVTETIAAVEQLGVDVEVGPFGSGCRVDHDRSAEVVSTIVRTAFANGASHVNIDVDASAEVGP